MSRIQTIYLAAGGQFRRRDAKLDAQWPLYLINRRDQMAHIIEDSPIFPVITPLPLNTWRDLVLEDPPYPPARTEARLAVCEDNSMWPLSPEPFTAPIEHTRQRRRALQEAYQAAAGSAAKARDGGFMQQAGFLAGVMIASAAGLLLVLIIASEKFGNG